MNKIYLSFFGKLILIAAYLAVFASISPAEAAANSPTTEQNITESSPEDQFLLADSDDDDDDDDDEKNRKYIKLKKPVRNSILRDISQQTGLEMSSLRIVKARQQIWTNSCFNLQLDGDCTQKREAGWQVIVTDGQQMWVYRTNESGTLVKLDAESTRIASAAMVRSASISKRTTTTTRIQTQERVSASSNNRVISTTQVSANSNSQAGTTKTVTTSRGTQISAANISLRSKKPGFTLAILQPSGSFSDVIARISIKKKRGSSYHKERFVGDYIYKIQQSASFVKGVKPGDIVVVRLYDTQNRFIGYTEFENLQYNTAVNLILSENPLGYKVVRTVYGVDRNFDDSIDSNGVVYDYFTQVSGDRVQFLQSAEQIQTSQFQVSSLSTVARTSRYPVALTKGSSRLVGQSINAFSSNLAAALRANPGSLVQVNQVSANNIYDLAQLMMEYREVGVARGIQVAFSDIPADYWAKDFIAELAAMEIIEGFPDGTFRPEERVTRAQFAAMLSQGFEKAKLRQAKKFADVSTRDWAYSAIRDAYQMGFLEASGNRFQPKQSLSRLETLLAIARGLNYSTKGSTESILAVYRDAATIRSDVRNAIAALTERGVVANYPNAYSLDGDKVATRAEVSALLYRALVSTGDVMDISSPYTIGESDDDDD